MSELSPVWGTIELTPTEAAAMRTDLHATTCPIPLGECVECMSTLRTVRKVIAAVTEPIAEQATKPLKERLEALENELAQSERDVLAVIDERDRALEALGRPDGAPVAAGSDSADVLEGVEASSDGQ